MSLQRSIGLVALLSVAASCASYTSGAKQAIAPKQGPKAYIHATYSGGMINRTADAVFRLEENAYVMVAHLAGDGRVEILFPEDARESGFLYAKKSYRTRSFTAYYDAVPSMYSFAMTTYRGLGPRMDSYDGAGHGYIFLIASRKPLDFGEISEFGYWNDIQADSYRSNDDPRLFIRQLADQVSGKGEYTLQFARSMGSLGLASRSDMLFDCAFLSSMSFSSMGFASLASPWAYGFGYYGFGGPYLGNSDGYRIGRGYFGNCGSNGYAFGDPYYRSVRNTYVPVPQTPGVPPNPEGLPPQITRPGHRRVGETGSAFSFGRPTSNRPSQDTRTYAPRSARSARGWATSDDRGSFGPRPGRTSTSSSSPRESPAERPAHTERPVQVERPQAVSPPAHHPVERPATESAPVLPPPGT
jgi:hypothetical protein